MSQVQAVQAEIQQNALKNAVENCSESNYPAIFKGFVEKGIDESEIIPRENVFTYNAWKALGRQVRKGEKGVRIVSIVRGVNKETEKGYSFPKRTTVFHVSQTDEIENS